VVSDGAPHVNAGGDALLGPGATFGTFAGPLAVTAGGSITGDAAFFTSGGAGGSVTLTATNGGIGFSTISASGSSPEVRGGDVILQARGSIAGTHVQSNGPDSGAGGNIRVTSTAGNITIDSASADGGSAFDAPGGDGGSIVLSALSIDAGAGAIHVGSFLSVAGGTVTSTTSNAGRGGSLTLQAGRDITFGSGGEVPVSASLLAMGGSVASGAPDTAAGGAGGTITLTSSIGDIQAGNGASLLFTHGGDGAAGGLGGSVRLEATQGSVVVGRIDAGGGDGLGVGSVLGGGGGGAVTVVAGQQIRLGPDATVSSYGCKAVIGPGG
jgi:hypothetical protein